MPDFRWGQVECAWAVFLLRSVVVMVVVVAVVVVVDVDVDVDVDIAVSVVVDDDDDDDGDGGGDEEAEGDDEAASKDWNDVDIAGPETRTHPATSLVETVGSWHREHERVLAPESVFFPGHTLFAACGFTTMAILGP